MIVGQGGTWEVINPGTSENQIIYHAGEKTEILGVVAEGGQPGDIYNEGRRTGGDGGSGGGAGGWRNPYRNGYQDGAGDEGHTTRSGYGQGTTTRAFSENRGLLYAGGGAGYSEDVSYGKAPGGLGGGGDAGEDGQPNTGGGGGGGGHTRDSSLDGEEAGFGGSGIVLIRPSIGNYTYVSPPETIGNRYRYRIKKISQADAE